MTAATIIQNKAQPLVSFGVSFRGWPHLGHDAARKDTSLLQAGHSINEVFPSLIMMPQWGHDLASDETLSPQTGHGIKDISLLLYD